MRKPDNEHLLRMEPIHDLLRRDKYDEAAKQLAVLYPANHVAFNIKDAYGKQSFTSDLRFTHEYVKKMHLVNAALLRGENNAFNHYEFPEDRTIVTVAEAEPGTGKSTWISDRITAYCGLYSAEIGPSTFTYNAMRGITIHPIFLDHAIAKVKSYYNNIPSSQWPPEAYEYVNLFLRGEVQYVRNYPSDGLKIIMIETSGTFELDMGRKALQEMLKARKKGREKRKTVLPMIACGLVADYKLQDFSLLFRTTLQKGGNNLEEVAGKMGVSFTGFTTDDPKERNRQVHDLIMKMAPPPILNKYRTLRINDVKTLLIGNLVPKNGDYIMDFFWRHWDFVALGFPKKYNTIEKIITGIKRGKLFEDLGTPEQSHLIKILGAPFVLLSIGFSPQDINVGYNAFSNKPRVYNVSNLAERKSP